MEIYLIRHTTPAISRGTCYGFADLDVAPSFQEEAARISTILPDTRSFDIYTSPLQRCARLATHLFGETVTRDARLKELNFGDWEMKTWDSLGENALQAWMDNYVYARVPGGESYHDLYLRSIECFNEIVGKNSDAIIVAHSGVIRAILAYATNTPLDKSFDIRVEYGRTAHLKIKEGKTEVVSINN
ncbi:alpha-ribazole phosphatase [Chitinophaga pendula]|uniref:alpha-ribazole phosphatase n=1 Tax=Chitinophaga TaxID=79328 RepID=UPI0012FD13FE|nr:MULTISPECIES: alpha-ribazole phosphatase [Chitinophaga]UCJ06316.1 alpha-ribazole phosphatase [Chitinophaga pendula]